VKSTLLFDTSRLTLPLPLGEVHWMRLALSHIAGLIVLANLHIMEVKAAKFVPVTCTPVPPEVGPRVGEIDMTLAVSEYTSARLFHKCKYIPVYSNMILFSVYVTPFPDTSTATVPAVVAEGVIQRNCVLLSYVVIATEVPNFEVMLTSNCNPSTVTIVPPVTEADTGDKLDTIGFSDSKL